MVRYIGRSADQIGAPAAAAAAGPQDPYYSPLNTIWNLQSSGEDILGNPFTLVGSASFETSTPPGTFTGYVRLPSCGTGGDYIECRIPSDDKYGICRYQMANNGCIEFWYRHTGYTASTTHPIFAMRKYNSGSPSGTGFSFHQYGVTGLTYAYNQSSATLYGGTLSTGGGGSTFLANTWYHVRLIFAEAGLYLAVDGVVHDYIPTNTRATPADGASVNYGTTDWYITLGKETQGLGNNSYECWFAGFRVTSNYHRGITSITVPSDPHTLDSTGYTPLT